MQFDEELIKDVVGRFFSQSSETRLKYMNGLKDMLQNHIDKQIKEI